MAYLSAFLSAVFFWFFWLVACTTLAIVLVWIAAARILPAIYNALLNRRARSPSKTPKSPAPWRRRANASARSPVKSKWRW